MKDLKVSQILALIGWALVMMALWAIFAGFITISWTGAGALTLLMLISFVAGVESRR